MKVSNKPISLIDGAHYRTSRRGALYYTILAKGVCTIQGDVLIKESALNEVVRYVHCHIRNAEKKELSSNAKKGLRYNFFLRCCTFFPFLKIFVALFRNSCQQCRAGFFFSDTERGFRYQFFYVATRFSLCPPPRFHEKTSHFLNLLLYYRGAIRGKKWASFFTRDVNLEWAGVGVKEKDMILLEWYLRFTIWFLKSWKIDLF